MPNPSKPLAEILNRKFNSSFQAFKALDIFNTGNVSEQNFQVGLRNLGLSEYTCDFSKISNGHEFIRLSDLISYLRNGRPS
jgi:hypothetical protein